MSSKEIENFNKLFGEFLEKIISKFPYAKLKTYHRGFKILKNTSPDVPANLFMAGCVDYKTQIKQRDDMFFLKNETVNDKAKNFGNFTEDCGLDVYWGELTQPTKKAIWDYIQSLFVLGEIIVNKNKDLFNKYNTMYAADYKNEINDLHTENFSVEFLEKIK
tara:strand:+ start:4738 stop:5223 length:486 start_codon:yes stop_codon:yes gene_type:complete